MKREESRQQALIFLFENEFSPNTPEEILEMAELLRGEKVSGFSKELFLGTLENLAEIDAVIELEDGRWCAFEIKLGANQIDKAATELVALRNSIEQEGGIAPAILCVICGLSNAAYVRPDGIFVVPITALKN